MIPVYLKISRIWVGLASCVCGGVGAAWDSDHAVFTAAAAAANFVPAICASPYLNFVVRRLMAAPAAE
jgi:hypothetical protein